MHDEYHQHQTEAEENRHESDEVRQKALLKLEKQQRQQQPEHEEHQKEVTEWQIHQHLQVEHGAKVELLTWGGR